MREPQRTLARSCRFSGVGIHQGKPGCVQLHPAPENSGLKFVVGDAVIPALADHVSSTRRCTVLRAEGAGVATVEHLLAALYGLKIDNARIEVDGPEIPILDGSAGPFAARLLEAGIREQDAPARHLSLTEPIWIGTEGKGPDSPSVLALPAEGFALTAAIDFPYPGAVRQAYHCAASVLADQGRFLAELAPARTFCFEEEVKAILAAGLGGGGSLENTVVVSAAGTSTPLRYSDELARHKTLDLLGDLALVGARLSAHVIALRAGHTLHVAMANAIDRKSVV